LLVFSQQSSYLLLISFLVVTRVKGKRG